MDAGAATVISSPSSTTGRDESPSWSLASVRIGTSSLSQCKLAAFRCTVTSVDIIFETTPHLKFSFGGGLFYASLEASSPAAEFAGFHRSDRPSSPSTEAACCVSMSMPSAALPRGNGGQSSLRSPCGRWALASVKGRPAASLRKYPPPAQAASFCLPWGLCKRRHLPRWRHCQIL